MASNRPVSRPTETSAGRSRRRAALSARARRGRLLAFGTMLAVFALFGSIVWYAWLESRALGNGEPPLLRASREPWRVAPADPGGLPIPNADRPIGRLLEGEAEPPQPERILPAEEPDVRALAALLSTDAREDLERQAGGDGEVKVAQAGEPGAPRSLLAPPPPPAQAPAVPEEEAAGTEPAAIGVRELGPAEALEPAAGTPHAEPATEAARPLLPAASSGKVGPTEEGAAPAGTAAAEPEAVEAPVPEEPAAVETAATAPEVEQEAAPEPPAQAAPSTEAQPVRTAALPASGVAAGPRVQLAAVSRRDGIERQWAAMQRRWPDALGGRELVIEPLERGGRTLYRIQAAGFTSKAEAAAACRSIRAGGGDCFVVAR